MVDTFGTSDIPSERLSAAVHDVFDLRPAAIIQELGLWRPIFKKTACYGHFGRKDPDFSWERTNRTEELLKSL